MAENVGSIKFVLDLDNKKFLSGMSNAKGELKGLGSTLGKLGGTIAKWAKRAAIAFGTAAAAAATFGLKTAGDLEAARQGFVALLGSAEDADKTMARIKKEAAATPFELTGLVEGTQALTAITKDGDKAIDILLDVGKAIAISGKGQAELDRVVYNLQQISATGKVTAMDIRQFQSAIPIFNDIIATTGMTTEELQNSETAAEDLFEAFKKAGQEGGITAAGFTAQAGTFNQLLSNVKDSFAIFVSDFVRETGIFDVAKQSFEAFITFITDNQTGMVNAFNSLIAKVIEIKNAIIGFFTETSIGRTIVEFFKVAIEILAEQLRSLWETILANKEELLLIAKVVGMVLVGVLLTFIAVITGIVFIVNVLIKAIGAVIRFLGKWWQSIKDGIKFWYDFGYGVRIGMKIAWDYMQRFYNWVMDKFAKIGDAIKKPFESIGGIASGIGNTFSGVFSSLKIPGFADGITNFGGGLAMVGEQGPELVNLPKGSDVIPNDKMGGVTVNVDMSGIVASSKSEFRELGKRFIESVNDELRAKGMAQLGV